MRERAVRGVGRGIGVAVLVLMVGVGLSAAGIYGGAGSTPAALPMGAVPTPPAAGGGCFAAGSTGLTALVVASAGETLTGTFVATGCDVGIYVGPNATGVTITHAWVWGANDHGIFVEGAADVAVTDNVVGGNGLAPHTCSTPPTGPCVAEDKAIELVGTTGSVVVGNFVYGNMADGGIGLSDDGPIDPGALSPGPLLASQGNIVENNIVVNNLAGCGIVVASYNAGAGVLDELVKGNIVIGSGFGPHGPTGPFVGGIVVAADLPNNTAQGIVVTGNLIYGSIIPGIVVHSNSPGDVVSGIVITKNVMFQNGLEGGPNDPHAPTGIMVVAEAAPGMPNPPVADNITIAYDSVFLNTYGVWTCHANGVSVTALYGDATISVGSCP